MNKSIAAVCVVMRVGDITTLVQQCPWLHCKIVGVDKVCADGAVNGRLIPTIDNTMIK